VNEHPSAPASDRQSDFWSSAIVFVVVMGISLTCDLWRNRLDVRPSYEEGGIAFHLLRGDGFASPFYDGAQAPPTGYCAPIYPMIIAGAYAVAGGAPVVASLLLLVLNSACFGGMGVALYKLGALYLSRPAGIIAALLTAGHPSFLFYAGSYWDSFVALAIFFGIVLAVAKVTVPQQSLRRFGLIGAVMGLLSLTCPSYVLAYPLLILVGLRGQSMRRKACGIAIAIGAWGVVLLPWTIRDHRLFQRTYYVRDELNFELSFGNQPFATGWMEAELGNASPWVNPDERRLLLGLGETEYFDLCSRRLAAEYNADPAGFWRRTGRRIIYVFISDPTQAQLSLPFLPDIRWHGIVIDRLLLHGFVAVAGLAGVWAAWRLGLKCVWIFGAGVLAEIPFVFASVDDRYVLPLRATMLFFVAILIWSAVFRARTGSWPAPAKRVSGKGNG
jgi:hypothetical protein